MSKYAFINLIDKLFISISVFLIIFAWINFYTRNLWLSFILGLIFSFACIFIFSYFLGKRKEKLVLTKQQNNKINVSFLAFRILTLKEQLDFLKNILKHQNAEIKNEILVYENENKKVAIILACNHNKFCENDFLSIVQQTKCLDVSHFEIVCENSENFNTKILKNKTYSIVTKQEFVKRFFEKYNTFPPQDSIDTSTIKPKFADILNRMFLPHKTKTYFYCGLILIFSSIIIPYHAYYIVFGSMLMLFAIVCRVKKIRSR